MIIDKKITSLVLRAQELVMENSDLIMYYQSKIYLLSIYNFDENGKYSFYKSLYLDGLIFNKNKVIKELKNLIRELEDLNNEDSRKDVCV